MAKKRLISRRVLRTELSVAAQCIEAMNYGYARDTILKIIDRVKEYDCVPPKEVTYSGQCSHGVPMGQSCSKCGRFYGGLVADVQ